MNIQKTPLTWKDGMAIILMSSSNIEIGYVIKLTGVDGPDKGQKRAAKVISIESSRYQIQWISGPDDGKTEWIDR